MGSQFLLPVLLGTLLNLPLWTWAIARRRDGRVVRAYLWAAGVVGLASLLLVAARAYAPEPVQQAARFALGAAGAFTWFVLGAALVLGAAWVLGRIGPDTARTAAAATAIYVAMSFLGFEIGKAAHDAEMRQFFAASSLPIWFMYAVMAVESAAAIGLFFARVRVFSAGTLLIVMLGAVGTHLRNGDAIQDSYDALRMLVLLAAILLLSCWRSGVNHETAAANRTGRQ